MAVPPVGACRSRLSCSLGLQEGEYLNLFNASFNMCAREREEREGRDGLRAL